MARKKPRAKAKPRTDDDAALITRATGGADDLTPAERGRLHGLARRKLIRRTADGWEKV